MFKIQKKGVAEGVDWMIAAGIFLIYLGLVFVFFKPGVKPIYDYEELATLVGNNINKDLVWNMTKIPVFTKPIAFDESKWTTPPDFNSMVVMRFESLGKTIDLSEVDTAISFDTKLEFGKEGKDVCVRLKYKTDGNYISFILFNASSPSSELSCQNSQSQPIACDKDTLNDEKSGFDEEKDTSTKCNAIYKIGSQEYLEGINLALINEKNDEYGSLKSTWNFPYDKDFKIVIYGAGDCEKFNDAKNTLGCFINPAEPPTTANVFVHEVNLYALDGEGNLEPYIMNVRVW